MTYEYDFESLELSNEQKQVIGMGLGDVDQLTTMVKELINKRSKTGWEPLFPFSVPYVWFRREIKSKKKTTKS